MKKYLLLSLLAMMALSGFQCTSQKETTKSLKPADQPDTQIYAFEAYFDRGDKQMVAPGFPGGDTALNNFMKQHITYPDKAISKNQQGYVVTEFRIDEDGKVSDINVLKDVGYGTGAQVQNAIEMMPVWNPAKRNGRAVETMHHIVVEFSLDLPIDYNEIGNYFLGFLELVDTTKTLNSSTENNLDADNDLPVVYEDSERVEEMPQFPGGEKAFYYYLAGSIAYPDEMANSGIQGRVIVSYVVECNGSITNVAVEESVASSLDKAAVQIVSNMPRWKPGTVNGEPVRVKYYLPVAFTLHN